MFAVAGQKRESEAVKLISIKAGLLDVSQSWNTLASKITILGKAQKVGDMCCVVITYESSQTVKKWCKDKCCGGQEMATFIRKVDGAININNG